MAVNKVEYKMDSITSGFASAGDEVIITRDNADIIKKDVDAGTTDDLSFDENSYLEDMINPSEDLNNQPSDEETSSGNNNSENAENTSGGIIQGGGSGGAGALIYATMCAQTSMTMNSMLPVNMMAAVDLGCGIAQAVMAAASFGVAANFDASYNERIQMMSEEEAKESEIEENTTTLEEDIVELDSMIEDLENEGVLEEGAGEDAEKVTTEEAKTEDTEEALNEEQAEIAEEIVDEETVDEAVQNDDIAVEQSEEKAADAKFLQIGHSLGAQGMVATAMLGTAAGLNLSTASKTAMAAARYASFIFNPYMLAQAALDMAATKTFVASAGLYGASSLLMGVKSGKELICGNKGDNLSDKAEELDNKQAEHQGKIELVGGETDGAVDTSGSGESGSTSAGGASAGNSGGSSTTA